MDATASWSATITLRAWEAEQLALTTGLRLLDVGCGLGEAGLALAAGLGEDGELVGIDASNQMIAAAAAAAAARARSRVTGVMCPVRFSVGDAHALDEPDNSFDAVRSERTLQWLRDPGAAVAEMARVARPGALVSLTDSDWSTFALDIGDGDGDGDTGSRIREAMAASRARPHDVGGRLVELVVACGLAVVVETSATQTWTTWDPDASPAPTGCFSMWSLADDLIETGNLTADAREDFVERIHEAARQGQFSMALTMFAVVAHKPDGQR
jgi:SAM-dependent methyltransferase